MERRHDSFVVTIDGVTYRSLDEVPERLRPMVDALLADHDANHDDANHDDANHDAGPVPDVARHEMSGTTTTRSETYVVDGIPYDSLDDVPEPARSQLRQLGARPEPNLTRAPTPTHTQPVEAPTPIVTRAGLAKGTKLLLLFVALDAIAVAAVAWVLLR